MNSHNLERFSCQLLRYSYSQTYAARSFRNLRSFIMTNLHHQRYIEISANLIFVKNWFNQLLVIFAYWIRYILHIKENLSRLTVGNSCLLCVREYLLHQIRCAVGYTKIVLWRIICWNGIRLNYVTCCRLWRSSRFHCRSFWRLLCRLFCRLLRWCLCWLLCRLLRWLFNLIDNLCLHYIMAYGTLLMSESGSLCCGLLVNNPVTCCMLCLVSNCAIAALSNTFMPMAVLVILPLCSEEVCMLCTRKYLHHAVTWYTIVHCRIYWNKCIACRMSCYHAVCINACNLRVVWYPYQRCIIWNWRFRWKCCCKCKFISNIQLWAVGIERYHIRLDSRAYNCKVNMVLTILASGCDIAYARCIRCKICHILHWIVDIHILCCLKLSLTAC